MRITEIQGIHLELTPAIKAHVEKKLKSVERVASNFSPCDVRADVGKTSNHHAKGKIFMADFTMTIPGAVLRAEAVEEDLYDAIDSAIENLKRQITKHKEK